MAKISLAGFKDPVRRPRYIVWTFTVLFALAAFVIVALGATSTRWFCAEVCHKVQDDTIRSYEASAHAEISCMACHEPVNADTVTFLFAKVKSGLEVIPTVGNTFHLPLNKGSALALNEHHMGSAQCVQCHSTTRKITPSEGIKIDHAVHEEAEIWCTVCHNRVAHNEVDAPPTLVDPYGKKNTAHPDFMKMNACFRCHDLENKVKMEGEHAKAAPGTCSSCHPAGFNLVPESHGAADWSKEHGDVYGELREEYGKGLAEQEELEREGVEGYLAAPVKECDTCHVKAKFCEPCHARLKVTAAE